MIEKKYVNEYIIGIYGKINIKRLFNKAMNAGLRLTTSNGNYQNSEKNIVEIEKKYDGYLHKNLGLLNVRATDKQLSILLSSTTCSFLHFVENIHLDNDFFSLEETPKKDLINSATLESLNSQCIEQTNTHLSKFSGKGVNVAILDTGIDINHPDFLNSNITTNSFIEGETSFDGNGHGTHCAGLIIGPEKPIDIARYGIAPNAKLFAGKVLRDSGVSHSRYVFYGIDWALENNCKVISISLGNRVHRGMSYSLSFEKTAKTALEKGSLIIAAAGNDSYRDLQRLLPVSEPANCPSIMAIGAINKEQKMYNKSNAGLNLDGGNIDLVAPGVSIQSCYKSTNMYTKLSGTSMATSYVAGIASLYIEAFPDKTPQEIRLLLCKNALSLPFDKRDVGAGLVQSI